MRAYRTAPVLPGRGESLAENSHTIADSWDLQANGDVTPLTIKAGSLYKAWWVCSAGHPRYRESVALRMKGARCPLCTLHRISTDSVVPAAGESLADTDALLAAQWDRAANRPLTPEAVKPDSAVSVWWNCSKGHPRFKARIDLRRAGAVCPLCAGEALVVVADRGSVSALRPDLAARWCHEKNPPYTPDRTSLGSMIPRWWSCPSGHAPFMLSPAARNNGQSCPECPQARVAVHARKIRYNRSLAFLRPEVAAEWDDEYNGALTPAEVFPSSPETVWWQCSEGHPRYSMSVAYRSKSGRGCTVCRKENPPLTLAAENPVLAAQWDKESNVITAQDVTSASTRSVWWICELQHSWRATVKHRHDTGDGCPLCLTQTAATEPRWPEYSPGWQQR